MKEKTFYVPGFHSDAVWLEDQRDYAISLLGDVEQNLIICRFDRDYGVFLHEITYLKPYFDTHPEEREYIKKLIKEGKIGTGGSYNQPCEKMISGEALIRNILYGRLFHEKILGDNPLVYSPWDVFGHCIQLSQILSKSRFIGCIWSKDIRGFHPIFYHQSLDGTKLLYRRVGYGYSSSDIEELKKKVKIQREELLSYGLSVDIRLDCSDFKPPTPHLVGKCKELKKYGIFVTGSGENKFFEEAIREIKKKKISIPVTTRDMEYHHQGTALTRVEFKIGNRIAENILISAEKFATIANLLGAKYPDKAIDKSWRQLLFGQHHDAITGPCCDRVYVDLMAGYREALNLAEETLFNSLDYIGSAIKIEEKKGIPLAVFNPLSWERTDVCRVKIELEKPLEGFSLKDYQGKNIDFEIEDIKYEDKKIKSFKLIFIAEKIPSFGYKLYYLEPALEKIKIYKEKLRENFIENEFYRLEVSPSLGGGIVSLKDLEERKELLNTKIGPANEIVALEELPGRHEPPWEIYTTGIKTFSRDFPAEVFKEKGKITEKIEIRGNFKNCEKIQKIILYKGIKRIDFETYFSNYRGKNEVILATFPFNLKGVIPIFEERFGMVTRKKSKNYLDFRTWQWRNYSGCGARATYQFTEAGTNIILKFVDKNGKEKSSINLGMMGFVVPHNEKLIETTYILQEKLIKKGITSTIFFDDCDIKRRKKLKTEDSTIPYDLNEDLSWGTSFRIAFDIKGENLYTKKLLKNFEEEKLKSYRENLEKQGYAYLFLFDRDIPEGWEPVPVLVLSAKSEEKIKEGVLKLTAALDEKNILILPSEVLLEDENFQVEDYGVSLINNGNILNSLEKNNTLCLFLFHTSPWGSVRFPWEFIPEHKTHKFIYSLYPHRGNIREGKSYKVGYEYNNPLIGRKINSKIKILPEELSFLKIEPENLIVTSLKPKGNPTASFSSKENNSEEGIILRFYEAEGKITSGKIEFFRPIISAYNSNLLEERLKKLQIKENNLEIEVGNFEIVTKEIILKRLTKKLPKIVLGREKEPLNIVHFKNWQHNTGAEPIGYSPVGVSLFGNVKTGIHIGQGGVTINTVKVGIVNNYIDKKIKGKLQLISSEGISVYPQEIEYIIPEGGSKIYEILVSFLKEKRKGIIKARIEDEKTLYQDILEIGIEHQLQWEFTKKDEENLEVEIYNPYPEIIEGLLTIVTPIEAWAEDYSLFKISPEMQEFVMDKKERKVFRFKIEKNNKNFKFWAVAKIAYLGRVDYKIIPEI
jgi:alpha-mannosidase